MSGDAPEPMGRDAFWTLIASTSPQGGDTEKLKAELTRAGRRSAFAFQERLAIALHAIDGRPFDGEMDPARVSPDNFLYRRCYLVSKGRDVYNDHVANPRVIPDHECEDLLAAAREAMVLIEGTEDVWVITK